METEVIIRWPGFRWMSRGKRHVEIVDSSYPITIELNSNDLESLADMTEAMKSWTTGTVAKQHESVNGPTLNPTGHQPAKTFSQITHAEWICFHWREVDSNGTPLYIRENPRPLDEAMRLAGGSIKDLRPFLWALDGRITDENTQPK